MSTKPDTRYAAKRRAAARKRNRELLRQIAVYAFIGLLVIGTISTVFVAQLGTTPAVVPTVTPATNTGLQQLVTQGDTAIATGDFAQGIGYYNAYLGQNPSDADVHFKLGKAYVDPANTAPDYVAGLDHLQRALNINPAGTFVADAQALINQYGPAANSTATAVAAGTGITGTTTITGTSVAPNPDSAVTPSARNTVAPTAPITSTTPITP